MDLRAIAAVVPLAIFTVVHVLANATAMAGHERFDRVVGGLARSPLSPFLELLFVGLPLAVHAASALPRALRWPTDASARGYGRHALDVVMRVTSVIALVFVLVHAWTLRGHRLFGGGAIDGLHTRLAMQLSSTAAGIPWNALGFIIGLAAVSFHLAYGAYALGARRGRRGTKAASLAVAGGGLLFCIGTATVVALATGATPLGSPGSARPSTCGSAAEAAEPSR